MNERYVNVDSADAEERARNRCALPREVLGVERNDAPLKI